MLRIKKLNMEDNAFTNEEIAHLTGKAVLKNSSTEIATGNFHFANAGGGNVSAVVGMSGQTSSAITVSKPANLTVELTSTITRKVVVEEGDTEIKLGLKGLKAKTDVVGVTADTVNNGDIQLKDPATTTKVVELKLTVVVATATVEAPNVDKDQPLTITPDNAAGLFYVDILANAINPCCKKLNDVHFAIRGAKPWNNAGEAQIVELKV